VVLIRVVGRQRRGRIGPPTRSCGSQSLLVVNCLHEMRKRVGAERAVVRRRRGRGALL
jgi:hypothetical protein